MELSATIHAREVLRFDYASSSRDERPTGSGPARRVEPVHLVTRAGRWYLVAWDLDRDDWRAFRVDRLTPRTPNGPRFTPRQLPGGDVAAFIASTFRGSVDGTGEWPCQGTVVLDLPAAEVSPYSPDGVVEPLGDDRCRLTQGSWSWVSLATSLGRFDADMHEVSPPALKDAFAVLAERCAIAARTG
ncbi:helix-turn-helix transcriptional regulator [Aeromicrobium sp. UC242_57]|uniref:helix-turn-helix transcriptional regulator n=1 Tax=Aeromicrobium sp. UC242_57 TaxID=3374624 RepID=UPI0037BCE807